MPSFSQLSKNRLATCDRRLQDLFNEVIKYYDCTIIEGHREEAAQDKAFQTGKSKEEWPDSKHNSVPAWAVDVAPYPIDWTDRIRFYHFAGFVQGMAARMGIGIRWGGDWDSDRGFEDQHFHDLPHFELKDK